MGMDNVYAWGYPHGCLYCLCRYCTYWNCPLGHRRGSDLDFCMRSYDMGACPRLDCDFFAHRFVTPKKYIKVPRKYRKSEAEKKLESLEKDIRKIYQILLLNQTK